MPSDDLELERAIQETIAQNWGDDSVQQEPASDPDATQFFTPQQFNTAELQNAEINTSPSEELSANADEAPVDNITDDELDQAAFDVTAGPEIVADNEPLPIDFAYGIPEETVAEQAQEPENKKMKKKKLFASGKKENIFTKGEYGFFGIPHVLSTVIWGVLILFIGITLGRTVWLCAVDLLALGKTGQSVSITVEKGEDLSDVAQKLEEAGLIRYSNLFETFAKLTGKGEHIRTGTINFDEKTIYDYNALISALSYRERPTDVVEVMIPEGYNCKQIFELLEEKGVCSVAELEECAANGELSDYWFLEGVKRGEKYCLEGFLFPDTYEFYLNSAPEDAIEKLLDGFEARFSDSLKEKFENMKKELNLDLTFYELVIMASMVQKEKATDLEGYMIASVFYNRMRKPSEFLYLNCDSTIIYAKNVYANQPAMIDKYDTYKVPGLPPTPICNPGLSSLDASVDPETSSYYYFVLDKSKNEHVFAKTYSEHQNNLRKLGYYD
jgi:UPF0755 protein